MSILQDMRRTGLDLLAPPRIHTFLPHGTSLLILVRQTARILRKVHVGDHPSTSLFHVPDHCHNILSTNHFFALPGKNPSVAIGQLQQRGFYQGGQRNGLWIEYYDNGQVREKVTWKDGHRHGPYEEYEQSGALKSKGMFHVGEKCGSWVEQEDQVQYASCPGE